MVRFGRVKTQAGQTILYSGRDDEVQKSGVANNGVDKESAMCLENWAPISNRIIKVCFYSRSGAYY